MCVVQQTCLRFLFVDTASVQFGAAGVQLQRTIQIALVQGLVLR